MALVKGLLQQQAPFSVPDRKPPRPAAMSDFFHRRRHLNLSLGRSECEKASHRTVRSGGRCHEAPSEAMLRDERGATAIEYGLIVRSS
jgi:Flp pilus assembly protein TadG